MIDKSFEGYVGRQNARIVKLQERVRSANRLQTSFRRLMDLTDDEIRLENLMANLNTRYDTSIINIDNRFYTEQFGVHMYQIWRYTEKMFREDGVNIFEGIPEIKVRGDSGPDVSPGFLANMVNKRKMSEPLYTRLKQVSEQILRLEEEYKVKLSEKRKRCGLANENLYLCLTG